MSANKRWWYLGRAILLAGIMAGCSVPAFSQTLSFLPMSRYAPTTPQYAPQDDQQGVAVGDQAADELTAPLRRQMVAYPSTQPPGTIIIDTAHTFLYLTLGDGKALRYGIGVGRQGFTWSGVEAITRKAEWPDWIPPAEMVARQPYLPRWVGGGPGNPLGARALYLGNTDYRIHGTNDPTTIGKRVSSGCIRLRNADIIDLYQRVGVGAKVVVLPNDQNRVATDAGHSGVMTARIPVRPVMDRDASSTAPSRAAVGVY